MGGSPGHNMSLRGPGFRVLNTCLFLRFRADLADREVAEIP